MRHECRFDGPRPNCEFCGIPYARWMDGPAFDCPGKPAGNTGRHETPSETGLWDRLRADLNNLGAAYGPITEGVGEAVATPEPVEKWAEVRTFETVGEMLVTMSADLGRPMKATPQPDGSLYIDFADEGSVTQADRNAYFDGIILAARMKRESQYAFYDDLEARPLFSVRMARDEAEQEKLKPLARAMSRPLDFEPRVGHKGVEIDE